MSKQEISEFEAELVGALLKLMLGIAVAMNSDTRFLAWLAKHAADRDGASWPMMNGYFDTLENWPTLRERVDFYAERSPNSHLASAWPPVRKLLDDEHALMQRMEIDKEAQSAEPDGTEQSCPACEYQFPEGSAFPVEQGSHAATLCPGCDRWLVRGHGEDFRSASEAEVKAIPSDIREAAEQFVSRVRKHKMGPAGRANIKA